ncbi:MAG: D-glycero-beta-D-manno-heptose-7-phosphate kinase [Ekhidna sp.]
MKSVKELFEAFRNKTVLVIGDVMIDSYIFGAKSKLSETAHPVINTNRKEKRLGGAANVALNIQALGATPVLCSVVGDDRNGQIFERLLDYQGMPNKGIIRSQNRITTNKLRVMAGSQQLLRVDTEDVHPLVDLDRKALMHHILNLSKESDLIIFEDYDQGTVHSEIISETIKVARENNIPVAVDPKQRNFLNYEGANLFKPNVSDLENMNDQKLDLRSAENLDKVINKLGKSVKADNYIVSLDGGNIYFKSSNGGKVYPSHQKGVADMSGVGNAVISIAGLGLTLGLEQDVLAELSSIVAGVVASYSGVVPINKEQVLKEASESEILKKYF